MKPDLVLTAMFKAVCHLHPGIAAEDCWRLFMSLLSEDLFLRRVDKTVYRNK